MKSAVAQNPWPRRLAILACVLAMTANVGSVLLYLSLRSEGANRRDQSCKLLERQHKADVDALQTTYSYLLSLTLEQRQEPLNKLIFRELPQVAKEARVDRAPDYCDEPNIGLPEPDPEIPKRPLGL